MSQFRYHPDQLLTADEVAAWVRISTRTVWRWTAPGKLPQPVRLSPRCTRWRAGDIQQFLDHQAAGDANGI
jgi:predicted DNA-binding transcriptional regulator AlpA